MRVEKFFLFFGPKLVSFKRGETEYGIAAIPLGGYVKISGMNPDEALPRGDEHRGYYDQPVWKRIVVIGAGPAVNIVLAFVILFVLALDQFDHGNSDGSRKSCPKSPAAETLKPGDKIVAVDGHRYPGLDGRSARRTLPRSDRLPRVRRESSSDGCQRRRLRCDLAVERDGEPRTTLGQPEYNASAGQALVGFSLRHRAGRTSASRSRRSGRSTRCLVRHPRDRDPSSPTSSNPSSARKSRGSSASATSATRRSTSALTAALYLARPGQPLARPDQPLPVPAPRRRPHLLEPGREAPRPDRSPCRTMERASVVGFVLVAMLFVHRPQQRHRPPHRRRLPRPLTRSSALRSRSQRIDRASAPAGSLPYGFQAPDIRRRRADRRRRPGRRADDDQDRDRQPGGDDGADPQGRRRGRGHRPGRGAARRGRRGAEDDRRASRRSR